MASSDGAACWVAARRGSRCACEQRCSSATSRCRSVKSGLWLAERLEPASSVETCDWGGVPRAFERYLNVHARERSDAARLTSAARELSATLAFRSAHGLDAADGEGGALYNYKGALIIQDCTYQQNTAASGGGNSIFTDGSISLAAVYFNDTNPFGDGQLGASKYSGSLVYVGGSIENLAGNRPVKYVYVYDI